MLQACCTADVTRTSSELVVLDSDLQEIVQLLIARRVLHLAIALQADHAYWWMRTLVLKMSLTVSFQSWQRKMSIRLVWLTLYLLTFWRLAIDLLMTE